MKVVEGHARKDLLAVPVDLVVDRFGGQGGLLNHCAMGLDTASRTSSTRKDICNIVGGRLDLDWRSSRSCKDSGKSEDVGKLHCVRDF